MIPSYVRELKRLETELRRAALDLDEDRWRYYDQAIRRLLDDHRAAMEAPHGWTTNRESF